MSDENKEPEREGMSRGAQTFWIVGAIAVAAWLGINQMSKTPLERQLTACKSIFISRDSTKCRVAVALANLTGEIE